MLAVKRPWLTKMEYAETLVDKYRVWKTRQGRRSSYEKRLKLLLHSMNERKEIA